MPPADQLAAGRGLGSAPALVPWEELPEGLRQANRAQADHISIKRRKLAISDSAATIEALAVAEHRRWMAEKIVASAGGESDAQRGLAIDPHNCGGCACETRAS